jgi:multimeric flavodoxin WrbA
MKVVLLSGSPKADGNTAQLLNKCAQTIEAAGVNAEVVSLAGKKIEACIACGYCSKHGKCGLNDDFDEIVDQLRDAQGFIVGAPVYYGTARGDVMNALQRIGRVSSGSGKFLAGMVGGPIAVARRGGQTLTLQEMLMFFLINDMIVPGSHYWNMVFGREPGEAMNDEEGVRCVCHFAENVANLVKKLHSDKDVTTA